MSRFRRRKVSGLYASGISYPVRADGDGGFVLSEGDAFIREQVLAACSPHESGNPFNEGDPISISVFQNVEDAVWQERVLAAMRSRFAELDRNNLARIVSTRFTQPPGGESDVVLELVYINLENAEEKDLRVSVNGQTGRLATERSFSFASSDQGAR